MPKIYIYALMAVAAVLIIVSQAFFTVDQREQAIVLQLGQPVGQANDPASFIKGPGLHAKIPFIQEVRFFDRRILPVDPMPNQVVISSASRDRPGGEEDVTEGEESDTPELGAPVIDNVTGEPIILDTFARYRINDPLQFLKTLRSVDEADKRLKNILTDATRAELGKTSLQDLLSPTRAVVMRNILSSVNASVSEDQLGIEIVDVRIVRADLTPDLRSSTVRRMVSELKERATETRAIGEERALEIRANADKERTILLADAARESQIIRGQGDKLAIRIYADAFNKDKDFYGFIRSMEAYRSTLADPETRLILSPNSEFFRYFQNMPRN